MDYRTMKKHKIKYSTPEIPEDKVKRIVEMYKAKTPIDKMIDEVQLGKNTIINTIRRLGYSTRGMSSW